HLRLEAVPQEQDEIGRAHRLYLLGRDLQVVRLRPRRGQVRDLDAASTDLLGGKGERIEGRDDMLLPLAAPGRPGPATSRERCDQRRGHKNENDCHPHEWLCYALTWRKSKNASAILGRYLPAAVYGSPASGCSCSTPWPASRTTPPPSRSTSGSAVPGNASAWRPCTARSARSGRPAQSMRSRTAAGRRASASVATSTITTSSARSAIA